MKRYKTGSGALMLALAPLIAAAQLPAQLKPEVLGPYNAEFLAGGDGLVKLVPGYAEHERLVASNGWSIHAWFKAARLPPGRAIVVCIGAPAGSDMRALLLDDGAPALASGGSLLRSDMQLAAGGWHFAAAVSDGRTAQLLLDGQVVAEGPVTEAAPLAVVGLAPRIAAFSAFAGRIAGFGAERRALTRPELDTLLAKRPNDALIVFESGSPTWPIQLRQQAGLQAPQPAWTLPHGKGPVDKPTVTPAAAEPALARVGDGMYTVHAWRLAEAPRIAASGAEISRPGFDARQWYAAVVPGTVLTTLVARGFYPDPAHGLNNMAIPESLARQDYWYRTEFNLPAKEAGKHQFLVFDGVNYAADVWLNGEHLGAMTGAFVRGRFDITGKVLPGQVSAVAVRVSPPPHPGIPNEQSMSAGRGDNGGIEALDGPTFVATEGWDWIPGIRDRNTGLWQDVEIQSVARVALGDPQIVTSLRDGLNRAQDEQIAEVEISVPVRNLSDQAVVAELRAGFDDVRVTKTLRLAPGGSAKILLSPAEYSQLSVQHARLWWPNGYGRPTLHTVQLTLSVDGAVSDRRSLRFGMRQVTYELSLMDEGGELRRVGLDFNKARGLGQPIMDVTHEHIHKVPGGWAYSLAAGAEKSAAVMPLAADTGLSPHLVIKVNGVRIAARGGNVGMDDLMKRTERARQEPFFRYQRDAHLNIIRNWVGQNTEESFYDLADEYGLLVLNDFWESTQNSNVEIGDVPLFLANAEDTVRRFRNHPSIAVWFGRNEGVPQPALNQALADLVRKEDGTRIYMPSSNQISLAPSGPYNWREPVGYFTEYAKGFAVEIGTPSFPTLESWQRAIPKEDLWPINDLWAYHDWHQDRNGSVASFMEAMQTRFGAATSLEDFERKAQMLEYEAYRAIFEGFNAGLWKTNSARMLWMTQPAWPSSHWQILSSDYDTHGAYYGVQKGSEPVHVQMNLPGYQVVLVNSLPAPLGNIQVRARVVSLDSRIIATRETRLDTVSGGPNEAFTLDLAAALAQGPALVRLEARDGEGRLLSDNFYWQAGDPASLRALNTLPQVKLVGRADQRRDGDERVVAVTLGDSTRTAALAAKLTLFGSDGRQILPAYFSDNYVSLLPGESKRVEIRYPGNLRAKSVKLRGWNVVPAEIAIGGAGR